MKSACVLFDLSNLYHSIRKKYKGRKLDFKKYLEWIGELVEVKESIAYGYQVADEAKMFIEALQKLGITTKFKEPKKYGKRLKTDWDVEIALTALEKSKEYDTIILATSDSDMLPVVGRIEDVIIMACNIPDEVKLVCNRCVEIPESLLEK